MTGSLFDGAESERRKHEGMRVAAMSRTELLRLARECAVKHAMLHGDCTADDVQRVMSERYDIDSAKLLGPASGSLFKGSQWRFTGEYRKSTQVRNHAREQKVWVLHTGD
jgi:hypothetical protein